MANDSNEPSSRIKVILAIIGYSICSSTLLLANKAALIYFPFPSTLSLIQIVATIIAVMIIMIVNDGGGFTTLTETLRPANVRAYSLYTTAFVFAIYANLQALHHSNVDTVIVFRACSPVVVSIIEYFFLDREWPSRRSSLSLFLVVAGALAFCLLDSELSLSTLASYKWVTCYLALISFEMTYGKKLTSSVKLPSMWCSVLLTNFFAFPGFIILGWLDGDFDIVGEKLQEMPVNVYFILLFSCVVAVLIGYTGWLCRSLVSATTYTLVGVVNKFLTVLLNIIVWDKHSPPLGIVSVCCCLLAGTMYEQAPIRADSLHKYANTTSADATAKTHANTSGGGKNERAGGARGVEEIEMQIRDTSADSESVSLLLAEQQLRQQLREDPERAQPPG